ncbi:hypothetical protein HN51_023217 [Arachis hypogaea]|uniref:Uncharacterized protein n=1 Tax=Arachis hypogaea TaxID=3818 RepID=A0A445E6G1_ARAHY|nr:hypothetical protein Ahy_A02g005225 [Arachis hypogaea]
MTMMFDYWCLPATFPNTIIFSFDIDECQQLFTPLSYQISDTLKPLLDVFQDPALSSKIQVHLDGQVTFLGSAIEMKDFLSLVAESYFSQISYVGEKQSILVPHFSRYNFVDLASTASLKF